MGLTHSIIEDEQFIYENLEYLINNEITENKEEIKSSIEKLSKIEKGVLKLNFSIFEPKYVELLGEQTIVRLAKYPDYANYVMELANGDIKLLEEYLSSKKCQVQTLSEQELLLSLVREMRGNITKLAMDYSKLDLDWYGTILLLIRESKGNVNQKERKELEVLLEKIEREYITPEKCKEMNLTSKQIIDLIQQMGKTENYLIPEICNKFGFKTKEIVELIRYTGEIGKYLTAEQVKNFKLDNADVETLVNEYIEKGGDIGKIYELGLDHTVIRDAKYIAKSLDSIIERENLFEKADTIKSMCKKDPSILKCNLNIADKKYIDAFGEEAIVQMAAVSIGEIRQILTLGDKEVKLLGRCLNKFKKDNKTEEWDFLLEDMLHNITKYGKLIETIEDIDSLADEEIDVITVLMSENIDLEINTLDDIRNIEEKKRERCEKLFDKFYDDGKPKGKNELIKDRISAICLSKFGQTYEDLKYIVSYYGENIYGIEDEDLKYYVKSIDEMINLEDLELIDRIYSEVSPTKYVVSKIAIERKLTTEYWKLYKKELFSLDTFKEDKSGDLVDGETGIRCRKIRENMYEIPIDEEGNVMDFAMIVHGRNGVTGEISEDYYASWNRESRTSRHICTSYITRCMTHNWGKYAVCYGFYGMEDDALIGARPEDAVSNSSGRPNRKGISLIPNEMINRTSRCNEFDIRRVQANKKKNGKQYKLQPDYIVVFRKNGKFTNDIESQKAAKDFEKATGKPLPILVVDIDKCLETERKLIDRMIETFNKERTPARAIEILQKIRNNRQEYEDFCSDIDLGEIKRYIGVSDTLSLDYILEKLRREKHEVTMDELEQCNEQIEPEERAKYIGMFKSLYQQIRREKQIKKTKGEEMVVDGKGRE